MLFFALAMTRSMPWVSCSLSSSGSFGGGGVVDTLHSSFVLSYVLPVGQVHVGSQGLVVQRGMVSVPPVHLSGCLGGVMVAFFCGVGGIPLGGLVAVVGVSLPMGFGGSGVFGVVVGVTMVGLACAAVGFCCLLGGCVSALFGSGSLGVFVGYCVLTCRVSFLPAMSSLPNTKLMPSVPKVRTASASLGSAFVVTTLMP